MTDTHSGGCSCGAIRYRITGAPYVSYACHCTACQKRTSGAFGISLQMPVDSVTLEKGAPKSYLRTADSGNSVEMQFCGNCGTSIFSKPSARPDITIVYGGTLDDPSWVPIQAHIWTDSALAWIHLDDAENFPKAPDLSKYYASKRT